MCPRWLRCRLSIQPGVRRDGTGARGRRPHGLTAITRGPRYTFRSLARVVSLRGMQRGPLLTRVPAASSSARGTGASQLCFCFHGGGSVAASGAKVGDAPSGGGADARDGRHDHREGESASRLGRRMGGGGESEEGARHSGKRRHETSSPQPPESRRISYSYKLVRICLRKIVDELVYGVMCVILVLLMSDRSHCMGFPAPI